MTASMPCDVNLYLSSKNIRRVNYENERLLRRKKLEFEVNYSINKLPI